MTAYRKVPVLDFRERWVSAAPEAARSSLNLEGGFELWVEISLATGPKASAGTPPLMRAVNGPILDIREYRAAGKALYDASDIRVPVLLVHAEWDPDVPINSAQDFFLSLKHARYRRWVERSAKARTWFCWRRTGCRRSTRLTSFSPNSMSVTSVLARPREHRCFD
ncbi:hypothetical protein [Bradyrhizobium sp. SSUT77]|uniref:hypothetical protein n=1 Tax=Bradyrhizobium sp. SSUT77 TaxID=3040603 RepID=UPI00244913CF|nr:hypothetical protein [Bradyrhizobium sp. SSUT77]MDH2342919.1 hypothetical protein [Bradyrhizobium sp. SSUT77]